MRDESPPVYVPIEEVYDPIDKVCPSSRITVDAGASHSQPPALEHHADVDDTRRNFCLKAHSLTASYSQLTSASIILPRQEDVLIWQEKNVDATANVFFSKYASLFGWKDVRSESNSATKSAKMLSLLHSLFAWAGHYSGIYIDPTFSSSVGEHDVSVHDSVVCESLVLDCLRLIRRRMQTVPVTARNHSCAWIVQGVGQYNKVFSFRHWIRQGKSSSSNVATTLHAQNSPHDQSLTVPEEENDDDDDDDTNIKKFLFLLPDGQILWLCRLLEWAGIVSIVTRPDSTVVVLQSQTAHSVEQCVAILDLLQQQLKLEHMSESSQAQVTHLQQRALELKRGRQLETAKAVLRRANLCHQQVKNAENALLRIEESLHMLKTSSSAQQLLQALQQGNQVLQSHRTNLDELDEVLEDLAEQKEIDDQFHDALANANEASGTVDADTDSLLRELEGLSLSHPDDSESLSTRELESLAQSLPDLSKIPIAASTAVAIRPLTNT